MTDRRKDTTEDAKKKFKEAKRGKLQKPKIELQNAEFIGAPVSVRSIYDYVNFRGRWIPTMSKFGTFMVEMRNNKGETVVEPDGKPMRRPVDRWRETHSHPLLSSPLVRKLPPKNEGTILMHFPIYTEYIRYAKLASLYRKVRHGIERRVRFSCQEDLDVVALWVVATHFSRVFDHFPILDFIKAGYDAGGSVALKTVLSYCARPLILQSPTEASLFRLADDLRPTIGMEEYTTDLDEKVRKAINQLLDGSFDKKVLVPRTENFQVKGYDFFGPRAVVDPQGLLGQYSTASRSLVIPLVNAPGFQGSADDVIDEDGEVIQTLYDSFIIYASKVRKAYESCKITGSGRLDQAFRPLLAMALVIKSEGIDVVDSLMTKIRRLAENLETVKTEGDVTKQVFAEVRNFIGSSQYSEKWLRTRQDGVTYIRLSQLRTVISNALGIEFQNDKGAQGTRYWSRPSKEVAEYIQDGKRFAAMFKTFLPEFIGQAEPGTRNICLYFNDVGLLKERLNSLVGNTQGNNESYKILHVGFTVNPVFSYIINKKNKKILQYRRYNRDKKNKRYVTSDVYSHFVGFETFFHSETPNNATSVLNPTSGKHVGFNKTGTKKTPENTAPTSNPTSYSAEHETKPELQPDPVYADAQNETDAKTQEVQSGEPPTKNGNPITLEEGDAFRKLLTDAGFNLDPGTCGPDLNQQYYKIAVYRPSDAAKLGKLETLLAEKKFMRFNSAVYAPLIFTRPLAGGVQ